MKIIEIDDIPTVGHDYVPEKFVAITDEEAAAGLPPSTASYEARLKVAAIRRELSELRAEAQAIGRSLDHARTQELWADERLLYGEHEAIKTKIIEVESEGKLAGAEAAVERAVADERSAAVVEYGAIVRDLIAATDRAIAAAETEEAYRKSSHAGMRSGDFLPWWPLVRMRQWLVAARRRAAGLQ